MAACNSLVLYEPEKAPLSRFNSAEQTVTIGQHSIVLHQNWDENGVAGVLWDSAIILSQYASDHKLLTGKRIIELGAGLGLPSIVAVKEECSHMISTDQDAAIELLKKNIVLNLNPQEQKKIEVKTLDWEKQYSDLTVDLILGADLVYKEDVFPALTKVLINLSTKETDIYMASKIRYEKDSKFYDSLKTEFSVDQVYYDKGTDVVIFKMRKLS